MTTGQASEIRAGLSRVAEGLRMIDKRLADLRAELEAARGDLAWALSRLGSVECGDAGNGGGHDRG